jgi:hypothetical protein
MKSNEQRAQGSDSVPTRPHPPPQALHENGSSTAVTPLAAADAQELLERLRDTAQTYDVTAAVDPDDRDALRRAARLLVRRPGVATRHFLMAVEEQAHEVTDTQVEGRLAGGGDGRHE